MQQRPRLRSLLIHGLVAACVGCGGADRPASAVDSTGELVTDQSQLGTEPAVPTEPAAPAAAPRICEPRTYRMCKITYIDEDGQLQCPADVEICSLDGATWLACGMYVFDENHDPQPRRP